MYNPMLLTKDTTFIIGPIATILGYLMNGIFWVLDKIGLPNIGLSIILFTLIIYMLMLPMTIKQQKFSKLQQIMQPEIDKIQKKYKNKQDQESVQRMNEETQRVYKKYGVSPMGSCLQLIIQMPILFALYRVIYNIPAYVSKVKDAFFPLVTDLIAEAGSSEYLQETSAGAQFASKFTSDDFINNVGDTVSNVYIDVLNRFSTTEWSELAENFTNLNEEISNTLTHLNRYNNFLGLNIANSPWYTFKNALATGSVIAIIGAVSVPALAAITQLINVALIPQSNTSTNDKQQAQMQSSMKTMNYMMPIMSAWFCFTLPAGMGLYWIAGSVIRSIQQVVINKYVDRMDMDAYLKKQEIKIKKKAEKKGETHDSASNVKAYSALNTKNTQGISTNKPKKRTLAQKADYQNKATKESYAQASSAASSEQQIKYKKGSLTANAYMVSEYNNVSKSTKRKSTGNKNTKTTKETEKEVNETKVKK